MDAHRPPATLPGFSAVCTHDLQLKKKELIFIFKRQPTINYFSDYFKCFI
jgi:hypothetical protein